MDINSRASPVHDSRPLTRKTLVLLVAVLAVIWFGNLDFRKLVRPDEGRYAEIPREMTATGDWLTPRLNGIKYFEKPPLQYWATAAAYKLLGEHQWTVRLWPALTGFAGVVLVYFVGTALFGALAGLYAAVVVAGSLGYIFLGHVATLDMGVTFFMTLTLAGLLLGLRETTTVSQRRVWIHLAWAGMALATLSKGLIGIVLPGSVIAVYILLERNFSLLRRLHIASGAALLLAVAAPWFVSVSIVNPEFFHFFFIHEHFQRFLTKVHHRVQPWWYFLPILAFSILPWFITLCDTLPRMWHRRPPPEHFQPQRFLLIWSMVIFVFFSISSSKLPSYILPILPALALLMGLRLTEMAPRRFAWHLLPILAIALGVFALAPEAVRFASNEVPVSLYEAYVPWLRAAGGAVAIGTLYALYQCRVGKMTSAAIGTCCCALIGGQLAMMGHDSLARASSAYFIAREIKPYLKPDAPFYSVGTYEQTLPFYIKRTVTLVAFADEMAYGLVQEPQLWLRDYTEFKRAWRNADYALALMTPRTYDEFKNAGLPMEVIARDTRRVIVRTVARKPAVRGTPPTL